MPRDAFTRIQSPGAVHDAITAAASSGEPAICVRSAASPAARAPSAIAAGEVAQRHHARQPHARLAAERAVQLLRLGADLQHVAEHGERARPAPGAADRRHHRRKRRAHRGRVGVVAVIQDRAAAGRQHRRSVRRQRDLLQRRRRRERRDAGRVRHRQRRGAVRRVVRARERQVHDQRHVHASRSGRPSRGRPPGMTSSTRTSPAAAPAEREAPIGAHVRRLRRDERIGRRQDRPAVAVESPRTARPWRARSSASECRRLEVRGADVGDDADVRAARSPPGRRSRRAPRIAISSTQAASLPVADRIVSGMPTSVLKLPAVRQTAPSGRKRRGAQLLGRGLAVRSGDARRPARGTRRARRAPRRPARGADRRRR